MGDDDLYQNTDGGKSCVQDGVRHTQPASSSLIWLIDQFCCGLLGGWGLKMREAFSGFRGDNWYGFPESKYWAVPGLAEDYFFFSFRGVG